MPKADSLPTILVIFGASGDLTWRKLAPALYNLFRKDRLPGEFQIVGVARTQWSDTQFRQRLQQGVQKHSAETYAPAAWKRFAPRLHYFHGDVKNPADFVQLKTRLAEIQPGPVHRLYYLAIDPELFPDTVDNLGQAVMAQSEGGRCNIIIEKPFGRDLESALALNRRIMSVFREEQIFRIDHYLGKETAQNILFLRFANTIFEPVWNRNYVDNVQISVVEQVDVGERAGYYDDSGVLRDMFQSHLLQLFTLIAMEPPASFAADHLRNEKVKVLAAAAPIRMKNVIVGQYDGYRAAPGVAERSRTPTFAALRLDLQNWRWQGVPFYLRSGKALKEKRTEIIVEFKKPPLPMFTDLDPACLTANMLSICIQPDEGVHLNFEAKEVDTAQSTRSVDMEFHYKDEFEGVIPEAYERLLLDAINGDAALFARSDEIELAWKLIDPVIRAVEKPGKPRMVVYARGSMGPPEADELTDRDGRCWHVGCRHPEA